MLKTDFALKKFTNLGIKGQIVVIELALTKDGGREE